MANELESNAGVACSWLEGIGGECIRPRFCAPRSRADHMRRTLCERRRAHQAELGLEINRRQAELGEPEIVEICDGTNQIRGDDQFRARGKSGRWVLKEWPDLANGQLGRQARAGGFREVAQ